MPEQRVDRAPVSIAERFGIRNRQDLAATDTRTVIPRLLISVLDAAQLQQPGSPGGIEELDCVGLGRCRIGKIEYVALLDTIEVILEGDPRRCKHPRPSAGAA